MKNSSIFQNFQKEDYLAKYTEFFGNFLLGISVPLDFPPEISRTFSWLVFIMDIQQLYTFPCINVNHSLKIISSLYCAVSAPYCLCLTRCYSLWTTFFSFFLSIYNYEPHTLSLRPFKFFFQQLHWFLQLRSCFIKW